VAGSRPIGVTVVAVLAWITGAVQIAGAVVALIFSGGFSEWIALALGVLTIAVSLGLSRGTSVARIIMATVFVLDVAVGVWALFLSPYIWIPLSTAVLGLVGLGLLFSRRANEFFR